MTKKDNFDFDRKIRDALFKEGKIKLAVTKEWLYRPLEEVVAALQHGIVILIVVLAICIFIIGFLKLINVIIGISVIQNIGNKITPLLMILDLCLIAITMLVLSREIYRAFVKYDGRFGEQSAQKFEGDSVVLEMVVVTTAIVFLTIIIYIGQRLEDIGLLGINDVLYLAISIAIVIISLAAFLFVKYRKL